MNMFWCVVSALVGLFLLEVLLRPVRGLMALYWWCKQPPEEQRNLLQEYCSLTAEELCSLDGLDEEGRLRLLNASIRREEKKS